MRLPQKISPSKFKDLFLNIVQFICLCLKICKTEIKKNLNLFAEIASSKMTIHGRFCGGSRLGCQCESDLCLSNLHLADILGVITIVAHHFQPPSVHWNCFTCFHVISVALGYTYQFYYIVRISCKTCAL
jgi:hypothetical protein